MKLVFISEIIIAFFALFPKHLQIIVNKKSSKSWRNPDESGQISEKYFSKTTEQIFKIMIFLFPKIIFPRTFVEIWKPHEYDYLVITQHSVLINFSRTGHG